jgi:putative transposase
MEVFFEAADYRAYKDLLSERCKDADVAVWAYCLMPNHVHLILVPADADGLRRALARTHKRYTERINRRFEWAGHLWQGRFAAVAMDQAHLLAAVKYVELNPVRAGLCANAADWRWSSARTHLGGEPDGLTGASPLTGEIGDWRMFLAEDLNEEAAARLRRHERNSLPLGNEGFIREAERRLGRHLRSQRIRSPRPPANTANKLQ